MLVADHQQFYYSFAVVHIHAAEVTSRHLSERRLCAFFVAAVQAFTVIELWALYTCEQDELNSIASRQSIQ